MKKRIIRKEWKERRKKEIMQKGMREATAMKK